MNATSIARNHWRWGLLALPALLAVLVMVFSWGHSSSDTARAVSGAAAEMALNVKSGGSCDDPQDPTKCHVGLGTQFTLSVEVVTAPANGYILLQTFIDYGGTTVIYKKGTAADEIVWPDLADATALSGQRDNDGDTVNDTVNHGGLTALLPPSPTSNFVGNVVELTFNCDQKGSDLISLVPAGDPKAGTDGALFVEPNGVIQVIPKVDSLTVNCLLTPTPRSTPTPTITPTPTATPTPTITPTPTATPLPPQMNITSLGQYALPKTCFDVVTDQQALFFTVCDNDFQGAPDSHGICLPDAVCEDEDPADGQIRVTVAAGTYYVVESKAPVNHTVDPSKQECVAVGDGKCELTFVNAPNNMPWFPWDIDGNGAVTVADIFAVAGQFGETKP